jgi:tRNA modification GTPase
LFHGARLATPGEFSKRALLNGKMDLAQAEAASALIQARSQSAVHVLANQLKGELGNFVNDIRKELIGILAYNEVLIDYAEEDLPPNVVDQITAKLHDLAQLLETTLASSHRRQGIIDGYKIAIIGKPNVGKSSLLNALLSYNRAIVSDIAGTTRDTIEESVTLGTHFVKIVDTAGIRNAGDVIEKIGIERSIEAIKEATIVLAMFDPSRSWEEDDDKIVDILGSYGKNKDILAIMNKSDLPQVGLNETLNSYDVQHISCKEDITPLLTWMTHKLDSYDTTGDILLVSKRQHNAVMAAKEAISLSLSPLSRGELEFFSFHIKEAIDAIGSITQPYDVEGMLDVMFGTFCLGK